MDAETDEPVKDGSGLFAKNVTAAASLVPEEANGTQQVEVGFDSTGLGGHKLVVFEKLSKDGQRVASHEDPSDGDQTVTACEIGTKLTDKADGDQVGVKGRVTLVDAIECKGLVKGDTYTVHGAITVKSTVDVTFEFDVSSFNEGDDPVAFEECLNAEGNLTAAHQDVDDAGQTMVIDSPNIPEVPDEPGKGYPKTGGTVAAVAVAGASACAFAAFGLASGFSALLKRRKGNETVDGETEVEDGEE